MPILNWIGKEAVINHHNDVPFRVLERKYMWNADGSSAQQHASRVHSNNKIIHGDNLEALKALLPEYEGRIKCIYIDPPYNTGAKQGEGGWCYSDNVDSPRIRRWLGQVVGKESEDLSRHDKWLCMMYPRLVLLQKLLSDDGAIFISIDDNEQANLKLICDEIFGANNFVANIPWRKRTAKSDVPYGISQDYELILCYTKSENFLAAIEGKERKYFETEDFPNKPWRFHDLTKQTTIEERPNSNFTIVNPKNGDEYPVNPLRSWAITKESFKQYYEDCRIIFPGDYDFLNITKPVLRYWKEDDIKKAEGLFGLVAASTNLPKEVGMSQDGTKEITQIFNEKKFNFPKPSTLIEYLIKIVTFADKDSIILDSFAGSGTTAHAVLNLNKSDGGNRKFILVEMEDYAENITAERVRRVINGYGDGKNAVEGTGGSFTFYELGAPIFNADGYLNESVGTEKLREYVWYTETRVPDSTDAVNSTKVSQYLLGHHNDTAYYFYYEPDQTTTLDRAFLNTIGQKAEQYVIYADNCLLSEEFMQHNHIIFKKIPRDIKKL